MKRGQITVFIIIGIIILIAIGTTLYITTRQKTSEYETARPRVAEIPTEVQPLRDLVDSCIQRLATDGLKKIGDSGGYIDTTQLSVNFASPTEGDAAEFSPGAKPIIAYWWYMKSSNKCKENCIFDTKRPPLYRNQGSTSIEAQLDKYITENLKNCLSGFEDYKNCKVQELGKPEVTTNIAERDIFFIGKYPLRAICDGQTFDIEDSYITIDLNLKEIYNLSTELASFEIDNRVLEQVTKNLISTFSDPTPGKLPPIRAFEIGPPRPGQFWIKYEVLNKLKTILVQYIPFIQPSGVLNYNYIAAPADVRDPELYENIYNRQFFLPINGTHDTLEARFMYFDWWQPYFDLNCNGQLCQADTASNFAFIPLTMNRYTFAYDLSFPVLVEIRNPNAFNKQGYSFKFLLEQNMRNSESFTTDFKLIEPVTTGTPSMFCDPDQRTSGRINITVKDGINLQGADQATISYMCGNNNCNLGWTDKGKFTSQFPRCIGGVLRITKQGYSSYSAPLDILNEEPMDIELMLEPIRTMNVTIKNYPITKSGKWTDWSFGEFGLQRAKENQTTVIMLIKETKEYEEPFTSVVELKGDESGELLVIPGKYQVKIMSFFKGNMTIPPDTRCIEFKDYTTLKGWLGEKRKKCYTVPEQPLTFNQTAPFPYGGAEYDYEFKSSELRGKTKIEFREFILAIDKVGENDRIIEDMSQIDKVNMYAAANKDRIYPVIT